MKQSDPAKERGKGFLYGLMRERAEKAEAELDTLREVARVAQWTVEYNAFHDHLKAALDAYHRTLLERPE